MTAATAEPKCASLILSAKKLVKRTRSKKKNFEHPGQMYNKQKKGIRWEVNGRTAEKKKNMRKEIEEREKKI